MLSFELNREDGILVIRPESALTSSDFEAVAAEVDPYIEQHGSLKGLVIEAEKFRGWKDFAALCTHLRFVRNHQEHITRIAAITDNGIVAFVPQIVNHFVNAEVRHFETSARHTAFDWVEGQ